MPSNRAIAILHIERVMNGKRIAIGLLAVALAIGAGLLAWQARKPQPVAATETPAPAEPQAAPDRSVPKAIQPVAPAPAPVKPVVLPPGTTVATPGGDPEQPIQPAPRGQRIIRDHRGLGETPPPRKVTPQGWTAAGAAIQPAIASCLKGPVTLQFTLTMSGGRAQVQEPKLMNAAQQPDAQACIEKALANLTWNTPDPDGSTPVTMPLTSSSSSRN
jgi:hypothetical protein